MWSFIKIKGGTVGDNFERDPPRDHPCQVWFNLVQGFQRRRIKCDSLRRTTDGCQKLTWPLARRAKITDLIFSILAHVKFWIPQILGLSLCKFEWVYYINSQFPHHLNLNFLYFFKRKTLLLIFLQCRLLTLDPRVQSPYTFVWTNVDLQIPLMMHN